ncbi:hypothetical protein [Anabaena lutea]|uniref:Uncharacterized protein n=1 Tax=Anabaena lutea FACHB-196 TaxID=2692881 RepID=A0ABR8FCE5_9NOST|nr:hypothetical protein [Anabaena lutea]MBD2567248.1 hypothetical protein [Anabaena lutea FACHB-196]
MSNSTLGLIRRWSDAGRWGDTGTRRWWGGEDAEMVGRGEGKTRRWWDAGTRRKLRITCHLSPVTCFLPSAFCLLPSAFCLLTSAVGVGFRRKRYLELYRLKI